MADEIILTAPILKYWGDTVLAASALTYKFEKNAQFIFSSS